MDAGGRAAPGAAAESGVGDPHGCGEVEQRREQLPGTAKRYAHRDVGGRLRRELAVESNAGSSCRGAHQISPRLCRGSFNS